MFNEGSSKERKISMSMILETVLFHNFFSPNLDRVISKYYFRLKNQKSEHTPQNRNAEEATHSKIGIKNHAGWNFCVLRPDLSVRELLTYLDVKTQ
jgi:hypothetical protein